MAKKKYRVSKKDILGGAVASSKDGLQKMYMGGTESVDSEAQTATDQQQMQAFMAAIYQMFKEGMTEDDVELQLTAQQIPYNFIQQAISVVKKYMEERGEMPEEVEVEQTNFAQLDIPQQESQLKQEQDALMQQYDQDAMAAAMDDEDEAAYTDMLYRENPYMQMGGAQTPYYPNSDIFGDDQPNKYSMKKGGKISRKKFMKNILKRFEEGGNEQSKLESAPKMDTLNKDVEKATKGFVGAVQGKAKEATAKELYSLAEKSGDPKLQQILMSGDQQQEQPMPMADNGITVTGDMEPYESPFMSSRSLISPAMTPELATKRIRQTASSQPIYGDSGVTGQLVKDTNKETYSNLFGSSIPKAGNGITVKDKDGNEVKVDPNYQPPSVPSYPDFDNWDNMPPGQKLMIIREMQATPELFDQEDLEKYLPQSQSQEEIDALNDAFNTRTEPVTVPSMGYGGMQYAETGDEMRERMKSTPKKGSRMYSFLLNNPIPEGEPEAIPDDLAIDPEYGKIIYNDRYVTYPSQSFGFRDLLFPANRMFGYRPKYMAPSSWGTPVARDVYKRGLLGRPKKWMEYYEVPEETDLSQAQILRQRDINKAARTMNRGLKRMVRGKGSIYDAIMDRFDTDAALDEASQEGVNDVMTDEDLYAGLSDAQIRDLKRNIRRDERAERIANNTLNQKLLDIYGRGKNFAEKAIDFIGYRDGGQYYYGPGGANSSEEQVLGMPDPVIKPSFLQPNPTSLNYDYDANPFAFDPMRGASSVADDSIINTSGNVPGVAMTSEGTYEEPGGNLDLDPNKKLDADPEKTKIVGFENRMKRDIIGGQEFLNPFNAISNRVLGGLENVQQERAANKLMVDATDPMNMYQPETYKDRGDFDIYGNFRPDEQGFIGSTNNPGMTGQAKYGGYYKKGAVVDMTAAELQQFMEAGGQIEFV